MIRGAPGNRPIQNGVFEENCYLLGETGGSEAVIVDPGEEPNRFLEAARARGWKISGIWLTHAHIDHIMGVDHIKQATGVPIHLHPDDLPIYERLVEQGQLFGFEPGGRPTSRRGASAWPAPGAGRA